MNGDLRQLDLLAAFLYADGGSVRFRDRLRIERRLFRVASAISRKAGIELRSLDESHIRTVIHRRRCQVAVRLLLDTGALKRRINSVTAIDAYVHRENEGNIERRRLQVQLLALDIERFSSDVKKFQRTQRKGNRS
jgi:hypothetical protein